jgi:carbon-monoxide dehydrogenase small subunit
LQAAFLHEGGVQCGFCTPGMLVSATALLARTPDPSEDEVRIGLSGNLCRCTGYDGIVRAVRSVAAGESVGQPTHAHAGHDTTPPHRAG